MQVICENAKGCSQSKYCQHGKPHEAIAVTDVSTCDKAHRLCRRTPSVPICKEVKE